MPAPRALTPLDPAREGLNPAQARAAEHREGHLLVRAGPGTGKTRLLVQRAVGLLEDGLPPQRLLLVTFTRKAAEEMAQRLAQATPRAAGVSCGTFHSLGLQVITQARGEPPALIEPEDRRRLVARLAREEGWSAGEAELALTRAKQTTAPPPPEVAPLLARYQDALEDMGRLDLDDLVLVAVRLLAQDPELARSWRGRFAEVLVDEYQDVNPAQVELLQALVGEETRVCAIGDPDQAIYGFRGADRSRFTRFGDDFPGAARMGLELCYRCTAPVLKLAQALMAAEPDPGRERLVSAVGDGPRPLICALPTAEAEAQWVARRVAALVGGVDSRQVEGGLEGAAGEYAPRDIAVLYRVHAQAPLLARALEEAGVPVQVAGREPLAETDPLDFRAQRVSLLSMHAAKGLEWPVVFVTGLEEGLLPYRPPGRPPAEEDEERRLLFVAFTRARERLVLTRARRRTLFGRTSRPAVSPLLAGLPSGLLQEERPPARRRRARQLSLFG
jgi:DNA helicase-2/ATP-dependent DNA helicase PcrA